MPRPAGGTGAERPADLPIRFLAKLVDWILLFIINAVIVVPFVAQPGFSPGTGQMFTFTGRGLLSGVILAVVAVAYFALFEANRGRTPGKMLTRIEVRGPDGQRPSLEAAIRRNAWMLLSILPVVGGLAQFVVAIVIAVTISNDTARRQGWHDRFAGGTSVVRVG